MRSSSARRIPRARPRQPAARDAERPQAPRPRALRWSAGSPRDARRSAAGALADDFERAARQQHVRRALGEHDAAFLSPVSRWIVLINLRSDENGTSPTRGEARVERVRLSPPCAPRRAARLRSDRPARSSGRPARCSVGVVGAVGDRKRSLELDAKRAVDRAATFAPHGARPARSPVPSNVTRPLAVTTTRTVISFFVSVPVLSDAITLPNPASRPPPDGGRWRSAAPCAGRRSKARRSQRRAGPRHGRDRQRHAENQHVEQRRRDRGPLQRQ